MYHSRCYCFKIKYRRSTTGGSNSLLRRANTEIRLEIAGQKFLKEKRGNKIEKQMKMDRIHLNFRNIYLCLFDISKKAGRFEKLDGPEPARVP